MVRKVSLSKIYTWAIVLLPLLSIYGIPSVKIDIGTLSLLLLLPLVLVEKKIILIKKMIFFPWILYLIYIIFSLFLPKYFGVDTYFENNSMYIRASKNILYIILLLLSLSKDIINTDYLIKSYIKVAKICTIYIFLQVFFYYLLKFNLPGYISDFIITEEYAERIHNVGMTLFRPTSLFYEPAHYFEYVIIGVIILLFKVREPLSKDVLDSLFLSLGIVLSTSGMGIFTLILVYSYWFFSQLKWHKHNFLSIRKETLLLLAMIIFGAFVFLRSEFGHAVISRLFTNTSYSAMDGRTEIYKFLFSGNFENILLGAGYGNILKKFFYPSWAFNIWSLGVLGSLIIIYIYIYNYLSTNRSLPRLIILLNFSLCFISTLFMGKNLLFYFIFIYSLINEENYENQTPPFSIS